MAAALPLVDSRPDRGMIGGPTANGKVGSLPCNKSASARAAGRIETGPECSIPKERHPARIVSGETSIFFFTFTRRKEGLTLPEKVKWRVRTTQVAVARSSFHLLSHL